MKPIFQEEDDIAHQVHSGAEQHQHAEKAVVLDARLECDAERGAHEVLCATHGNERQSAENACHDAAAAQKLVY